MKLTMRLYQRTNGIWYVEVVRNRPKSLKTKNERTARKKFNAMIEAAAKGKILEIRGESSKTLGDFEDEYTKWAEGGGVDNPNTLRANLLGLAKLVEHAGRSCRLDRITLKHVDALKAACRRAKLSDSTINIYVRHARAVLAKAVEWGDIPLNPLRQAKAERVERRPPKALDAGDIQKLFLKMDDPDLRSLVAAYLATGRRRGELLLLTWDKVDLETGRYYVSRTKTNLSAWYPINATFRAVLDAIPGARRGRVWKRWDHKDTITHMVKEALVAAGLGQHRLHDFRHTFARLFLEAGGALRTLQDLLGHTEYRTTEIYASLSPNHLAAEIERVKLGPLDLLPKNKKASG
ncbi:tyrosine-type recombinase/integrase [Solidesulfovibrio sp.]